MNVLLRLQKALNIMRMLGCSFNQLHEMVYNKIEKQNIIMKNVTEPKLKHEIAL